MIIWALTTRTQKSDRTVVICQGRDREDAKREARSTLGGNPDHYICTPLTRVSDNVVIKFKMEGKDNAFSTPGG